jgi:hypothetical protein
MVPVYNQLHSCLARLPDHPPYIDHACDNHHSSHCCTRVTQDTQVTNAGYGSNLTLMGHVECDASIMHGCTGAFGGVAALRGKHYECRADWHAQGNCLMFAICLPQYTSHLCRCPAPHTSCLLLG